MNTFRTTFDIADFSPKISYQSKIMFIGSCFTEHIGNYMSDMKFQTMLNPTGIVYNPISIVNCLQYLINNKRFSEKDLDYYNDVWFSFQHHGRFSDIDKNKCLEKINDALSSASEFIMQADFLFLTMGSAFIYRHIEKDIVVANCHKVPASAFLKALLNPGDILAAYQKVIGALHHINPSIKIIFTVSPVRHWNDGAIENQRSKSVLLVSIHEIMKHCSQCFYFPAYELMMDDLRDYRFYAEDMLHPNNVAIDYIRQKFTGTFIEKESQKIMNEIAKLIRAKTHRPFHEGSKAHATFKEKHLEQTKELKKRYPFLNLDEFEIYFKK